jgi:PAS domain S-box-containing protein
LSLRNITEDKLRESEDRYRLLFETSIDASLLTTPDGSVLAANPAACRMFGWKEEEIKKVGRREMADQSDPRLSAALEERARKGYFRGELNFFRKDGSRFAGELSSAVFRDHQGNERTSMIIRDITERKHAEKKIRKQLTRLAALREIDRAINSSFDLSVSLNVLLPHAITLLDVDAATVLKLNLELNMLEFAAGIGFRTNVVKTARVRLDESYAGRAVLERRIVQIPDLANEPDNLFAHGFLSNEGFESYFGAPLIVKGRVIGVLEVFSRSVIERDQDWFDFFNMLTGQAAIAIDNLMLFNELQQSNLGLRLAYSATIEGWSRALDLRDRETEGHTQRVVEKTIELARIMGLPGEKLASIRYGALLHDIGKMGVPDSILHKPGALTEEEWVVMHMHPIFAYELLAPIHYLKGEALDIPHYHHEKWDGSGYPRGLKGEQIPLAARIFAVVDVWDALRSDRPYRNKWSKKKTLEYIKEQSGKHFDPKVVDVFLSIIEDE